MIRAIGSKKLLMSIMCEITYAIHPLYSNRPIRANKLGDAFYQYFMQGSAIDRPTTAPWQRRLANQLVQHTDLIDIQPGSVDSHGWVSVVATCERYVLTTLLITEVLDVGAPLCTLITPVGDYVADRYKA